MVEGNNSSHYLGLFTEEEMMLQLLTFCLKPLERSFLSMLKPQIILSWVENGRRTSSSSYSAVVTSCTHRRSGISCSDCKPYLSANKLQKRGQQTPLLIAGLQFVWQVSCNSRSRLAAFRQPPLAGRIAWRLEVASFWSPASCWSLLSWVGVPQQAPPTFLWMAWGSWLSSFRQLVLWLCKPFWWLLMPGKQVVPSVCCSFTSSGISGHVLNWIRH